MTISYADNIWRLLLRWKASIWKATYIELIIFLLLYYTFALVNSYVLNPYQKERFEYMVKVFNKFTQHIPITFLLGFYVTSVVSRWWQQFECIPWPDDVMLLLTSVMPGDEFLERRRKIARYLILSTALCWRDISEPIRQRFPTEKHLVSAGLMTPEELTVYQDKEQTQPSVKWMLPLIWCLKIINRHQTENPSVPGSILGNTLATLAIYRNNLRKLYCYDWVSLPLIYTQVATITVYTYFGMCVIGRQFTESKSDLQADLNFPIFTVLQLLFFVGWYKVGRFLVRPFGSDDDDLELSYLLDRHTQVAFSIIDNLSLQSVPTSGQSEDELARKLLQLPHTNLSANSKRDHPPQDHIRLDLKEAESAAFVDRPLPRRIPQHTREF